MLPRSNSDVNFIPLAVLTLESSQKRLGKSWEPVLGLLREMRDSDLPDEPDIDLLPPIDHYLSRADHHSVIRDALWTLSSEVTIDAKDVSITLRTMSLVYQLYAGRTMAAFRVHRALPHPAEQPGDFATYMQPMNRVANILFMWRGTERFRSLYPFIPQFTTQQLTSITLHRLHSGLTEREFYRAFRRRQLLAWLGLIYEILNPRVPLEMNIKPIVLLRTAERIVPPLDGFHIQTEWLAALIERGAISTTSVDNLSPEQLFALRRAHVIWRVVKKRCIECHRKIVDDISPRQCSDCHRVIYCTKGCQARHWEASHREICKIWHAVNVRSNEPEIRKRMEALPIDITSIFEE
ncbi:unnamed protein product [Peniophora sp. CBMAI 1063]|nr:unnamed protein product [Peniophora sp. CBMAI 1063]